MHRICGMFVLRGLRHEKKLISPLLDNIVITIRYRYYSEKLVFNPYKIARSFIIEAKKLLFLALHSSKTNIIRIYVLTLQFGV